MSEHRGEALADYVEVLRRENDHLRVQLTEAQQVIRSLNDTVTILQDRQVEWLQADVRKQQRIQELEQRINEMERELRIVRAEMASTTMCHQCAGHIGENGRCAECDESYARREARITELEEWKEEAIVTMRQCDLLHEFLKPHGRYLGWGAHEAIVHYAKELEQRIQALKQARETLIRRWREKAEEANALVERYSHGGDHAGNGFAFLKELRIWTTCASELEAVAAPPDPTE